jgi:hypothetical protein
MKRGNIIAPWLLTQSNRPSMRNVPLIWPH